MTKSNTQITLMRGSNNYIFSGEGVQAQLIEKSYLTFFLVFIYFTERGQMVYFMVPEGGASPIPMVTYRTRNFPAPPPPPNFWICA